MQNSPETKCLPPELRSTLADLMEGATFFEENLKDDCRPLLIMSRQHALTAFGVGQQADYQPLYEAFKKHYSRNSAQWSTKDVAFVYCLPEDVTVDPDFCSRVEVDVYFCRKYVVRLDGAFADNLARLPFLPLSPITPGFQTRPPSAQTLLRQRNIKADLAKALVIPAKSSASKILAECLAGTYGPPKTLLAATSLNTTAEHGEGRVQATLKSISIQNFRAYQKKKVFELGSAVTILYGPNGFGKTSFFDAIDFAVTGGVGRLAKAPGGIARVAKHLDSLNEPTEVSLTVEREGKTYVITRNLADVNNASVDGEATQRKEVLSLLTGGAAPGADRVDSLVALFRATHLFSQENQELTQNVASKCELSSELVSRMLAFEDYANGLKKAEEVLKLAMQEHSTALATVADAELAIARERKELERLEGLVGSNTSSEALEARFASLEEAILSAGFDIPPILSRDTRGLRAMLDAAASEAVARRTSMSRAIQQIETLSTLRQQLEPMRAQLTERQTRLIQAETQEKEASELLSSMSSKLAELKSQEKTLQHRRDWLSWATSAHPEYEHLTSRAQRLTAELATLSKQLNQQRTPIEQAQAAQHETAASVRRAETALKAASEKRLRFQSVTEHATAWEHAAPSLVEFLNIETQLRGSIEELRGEFEEALQAERLQERLAARTEHELSEARRSNSRLKELISELRGHVYGANCQLCGHDHGSTESLLAAIDQRAQDSDHVIQLTEAAVAQRAALHTLVGERQALAERVTQDELRLNHAQIERSKLEKQRANYEASLISVGLTLTGETPGQIQSLNVKAREDELKAAAEVGSVRQLFETAETALASALASYQALDERRQATEALLNDVQRGLTRLLTQANQGSINLASGLQTLADAERTTEEQRILTSAAVQSAHEQTDNQRAVHAAAKATVTATRTSFQQANQSCAYSTVFDE